MISLPTRWRLAGQNFLNCLIVVGGAVAEGGDVVGEGVEPDVDDVFFFGSGGELDVFGDGDAPGETAAGDGEVFEGSGLVGITEGRVQSPFCECGTFCRGVGKRFWVQNDCSIVADPPGLGIQITKLQSEDVETPAFEVSLARNRMAGSYPVGGLPQLFAPNKLSSNS